MNRYDYKDIHPFKWFVLENFPFIEADFDALTNWQLFCKIGKQINKIIDSQNEVGNTVEEYTQAFINLYNYVHNYFDNLDVQEEINNKLDEMVEDGTFDSILRRYYLKSVIVFDCVADMVADTGLLENITCRTLGYYTPNDGGGALYLTKTKNESDVEDGGSKIFLDNNLVANLLLNDLDPNFKHFGAKGDGTTDDTQAIQKCIDYSYDNSIMSVFVPDGTYKITSPIFLYNNMTLHGVSFNSCVITKSTNNASTIAGYNNIDAMIILTPRSLQANQQAYKQEICNIRLTGNVTEYVANKEYKQYAIISTAYSPKIKIHNFLIDNVDYGIYTPSMYTGEIKDCTWLSAHYGAISVHQEAQGVNIQNINTGSAHEFGIKLRGGAYSTLSNILVEWNNGNICYDLGYWNGNLINCGAEQGSFSIGVKLEQANVSLVGGFFNASRSDADLKMLDINNSTLEVENTSFALSSNTTAYEGMFAYIHNKGNLVLKHGVKSVAKFNKGVTSSGNSNTITINNQIINLNSKIKAIAGTTQYYDGNEIEKLNTQFLLEDYLSNSIYTGFISSPTKTTTNNNIEYARCFNKGDIGIYNNPTVNGKAMWLCNRTNASNDTPQTVGTITSVSSGTLALTDITLEDYENTGLRLYNNCTIVGVESGATAIITYVNYGENKLVSTYDLSGFTVGEKVKLGKTSYVRLGDYLQIPIISSGVTSQRPFRGLTIGQMYFDTTLNKPIWYKGSNVWVDSTGTSV